MAINHLFTKKKLNTNGVGRKKQRQLGDMGGNMGVSGALRIKENERIRKQAALSYAHLEWNIGRLDGWMILKF